MTGLDGRRVYLDWNATAPLRPEARAAMLEAMDTVGNPSSVHAEGRAARAIVERARAQVARLVGCEPSEIVFTSGATEAASVISRLGPRVIPAIPEIVHDALWEQRREHSAADEDGAEAVLVTMGLACGETGLHFRRVPDVGADVLLLDISQAAGKLPVDLRALRADLAILSAHKLGGPKGAGALIVRSGFDAPPLLAGGGQEMGRRSGTENVIGIAGFGAAAEAALRDLEARAWDRLEKLRNILEDRLATAASETICFGQESRRLPNTSCVAVPGWKGETQVMQMDLAGFAVSAGSACSSGKVRESRVVRAMGYDAETAASAIRVSMGPTTTEAEVLAFADAWATAYKKRRARAA